MGQHPILTRVYAPKQVPDVMGFAHHENSADLCPTDVKELAYASTMGLGLSHHESKCIRYQYSYMIEEKKNHSFMTKQLPAGWTCFKNHRQAQQNALKENW